MAKTVIKWETPGLLVGCGAGFVSGPPHSHTVIITENQIVTEAPVQVTMVQSCPEGASNCILSYQVSESFTHSFKVSAGIDPQVIPVKISAEYGYSMTASISETHTFSLKPGTSGKILVQPYFYRVVGTYSGPSNIYKPIPFEAKFPKTMNGNSLKADGEVFLDITCLKCQWKCDRCTDLKIR